MGGKATPPAVSRLVCSLTRPSVAAHFCLSPVIPGHGITRGLGCCSPVVAAIQNLHTFKIDFVYLFYICECFASMCVCMYVYHVCTRYPGNSEESTGPRGTGMTDGVSYHMGPGTEPKSSAGAAHALTCPAISPAPPGILLTLKILIPRKSHLSFRENQRKVSNLK